MKSKGELNKLKGEVETSNKKLVELSDEELAQVSGGGQGGQELESLEGLTHNDIENNVIINGVHYTNSWCIAHDSKGRECYIYGADDRSGFFLIPLS